MDLPEQNDNPLDDLAAFFERFPGIGPRQARRFVNYLLAQNGGYRSSLARRIEALGRHTARCKKCFKWFTKTPQNGSEQCAMCTDASRDTGSLLVLEKDSDIANVEKSGFRGLYFVLGGVVPLAEEEPEKFIRAKELRERVVSDAQVKILKEVILGLSATAEGEHTRLIVQEKLLPLKEAHPFLLSTLGRGLSTGSELEYADPETIASALSSRN